MKLTIFYILAIVGLTIIACCANVGVMIGVAMVACSVEWSVRKLR